MPYPFNNILPQTDIVKQPSYQEIMSKGYNSEDLMDFDKSDKAVNASSRLSEIDAEIARLKQRIAEKRAEENAYNRPASVYDYIIGGDRSGLDRIAQQKMTKELANKQQINTALDKMDELVKLRNKAVINVNYAEQALKYAKNKGVQADIDAAERDLQLAKEDLAYYNNRTGYKETSKSSSNETPKSNSTGNKVDSEQSEPQVSLDTNIERYKAMTKFNTKADKQKVLDEIKKDSNYGQSPELQAEYERINKIKSDEQLANEKAERKAKWEEGQKLKGYDFRKWAESPEGKKLIDEFGEH